MKPLHIVLLIAAGAIGGAVVMKVTQSPSPAPAVQTAQIPASTVTTPAQVPQDTPVAEAQPPAADEKPSPVSEKKARHEATPARRSPPKRSEPVKVAQNQPPAVVPVNPSPAQQQPQNQPPAPAVEPKSDPEPVAPPPPPPPPPPQKVTLKPGTNIQVRLVDGLSSERNNPGDSFTGTLDAPLAADGFVIAERGARVEGRVTASDKGGRVQGVSSLAVELTKIHTSDGQTVAISTEGFEKKAEQSRKSDAAKVGAGAAIGAVIGAIAGGGKGAAIGAGVGGGAGAGDVLLTRGKPAALPSETRLTFRLREAVTITERQK
jgi:hypothetical protein